MRWYIYPTMSTSNTKPYTSPSSKRIYILSKGVWKDSITVLFIILWVYTATSKLLDFEVFRVQLGKSPLITAFSGIVAWTIPLVELLAVGLLLSGRTRLTGLYLSLFLMSLFTAYIVVILNFSYYVPCSCGGVLEKLSWTQHIYFNLVFVILAIVGILMETKNQPS